MGVKLGLLGLAEFLLCEPEAEGGGGAPRGGRLTWGRVETSPAPPIYPSCLAGTQALWSRNQSSPSALGPRSNCNPALGLSLLLCDMRWLGQSRQIPVCSEINERYRHPLP